MIFSSNRPTPGLSSLWSPHGSQEQWEKVNPNARATCQVAHVFFFFWPCHVTHGIFISPPRIEPVPLALGAQSFDPWTTRGFPTHLFLSCYWPKQITWLLLMQRVETETLEVFRAILYSLLCFLFQWFFYCAFLFQWFYCNILFSIISPRPCSLVPTPQEPPPCLPSIISPLSLYL